MNKNRNIYLLCVTAFLQGLVFYGPVATVYRQHRGISINDIFILETIFVILMFIFEIPWGYLADRIGYKKTLIISFFIFFISKIIFYLAHSFIGFLGEAILIALAISGISGCDSALIYSSIDEKHSDKAFSYYNAAGTGGFLLAALVSTIILKYSLDLTAFLTIIPYGIAFFITFFLIDVDMKKNKEKSIKILDSMKNLTKNKSIFIFVIAMALIGVSTHALGVFLNQPLYSRSGISIRYFGIITALVQVACLLSAKAYKLSEKVGSKKLYITSILIIIFSSVLLIYSKKSLLVVLMIASMQGAFALCQPLAFTIQNKSINTGDRVTLLSTYAMIADVIAAFSNLLIGKAAEFSLKGGILMCVILELGALILILIYFKKDKEYVLTLAR